MKAEAWIFGITTVFVAVVAPGYWFLSGDWTGTSAIERAGTFSTRSRKARVRPSAFNSGWKSQISRSAVIGPVMSGSPRLMRRPNPDGATKCHQSFVPEIVGTFYTFSRLLPRPV